MIESPHGHERPPTDLPAERRSPQHVLPPVHGDEPRQLPRRGEGLQRQVRRAVAVGGVGSVPFGVEEGLVQERDGAHQRTRIVLRRGPFAEAEMRRGSRLQQRFVDRDSRCGDEGSGAAGNAVGHVGHHRADARFAQHRRILRGRMKLRSRLDFRADGLVPTVGPLLVAELLLAATAALGRRHRGLAEGRLQVHKGGVQVVALQVDAHDGFREVHGAVGAHRGNAAVFNEHGRIAQHLGGGHVDCGMEQGRADAALVDCAVDREGLLCSRRHQQRTPGEKRRTHPEERGHGAGLSPPSYIRQPCPPVPLHHAHSHSRVC